MNTDGTTERADSENRLLAIAAMFENTFSIDWLADLTGCKPTHLLGVFESRADDKSLLRAGPGVYAFAEPDVRTRHLAWLPEAEKQRLHQKIADILMNEMPEDVGRAHLLTHHLLQTANDLERSRYLVQAGDAHLRQYNTGTAFQCYAKAMEDLVLLSGEGVDRLFAETAIKYSKLSTARHDTSRVLDILGDALERAKRIDYQPIQALLHMHIAKNEWLQVRYNQALKSFDTGWKLASALDDPKLLRTATTFSTFFLYWQGRFREVIELYEKSVPDVEKLPAGHFSLLAAITVGYCYAGVGQVSQGLGMLDAVRNLSMERGDLYLASYAVGNMGAVMISMRRLDEALKYLKQASKDAETACNDWVWINCRIMLSFAYLLKGNQKQCIRYLEEFLARSRKVQATVQPYPYLLAISLAMKEGRLPKVAGISLKQEINRKLRGKNLYMKGVAYRYQSYLQQIEGEPVEKAVESLNQAIRWGKRSGQALHTATSKLDLARLYLSIGEENRALKLAAEGTAVLMPFNEALVPDEFRNLQLKPTLSENLYEEILRLTQEVIAIRNNKDLIQHVITTVNRLAGAERGAMFQLDRDASPPKLHLRASKNLTDTDIASPAFASSMRMIEEVVQTGEGRIMSSEENAKGGGHAYGEIRSRICVPMILRNSVVGALYHDNRLLVSAFKPTHLELLAHFAAIAAISNDNAAAYDEIRRLNRKLKNEKQYYQEEHIQSQHFKEIVGRSPAIHRVLSQVEQVAETEATVLITGETGVGKELVARAIHRLSRRQDKPFIRVHCSALLESLIPSELFGHEKGAFTGATARRMGRFELADTGTLFLDEMGDISADIQTRLLRVLQTREFERVGGTETIQSDFRLIAATNRDLQHEVKSTRFRADLFYRLNVFPVHVPPLRERKEDIPLLVYHFLNIYSNRLGKTFEGIGEDEMDRLMTYDWPGNVRELENVIERACILSHDNYPRMPELEGETGANAPTVGGGETLREMEARHIRWALEKTAWKVRGPGGAAELLDINASTLRFRMKKLGIAKRG